MPNKPFQFMPFDMSNTTTALMRWSIQCSSSETSSQSGACTFVYIKTGVRKFCARISCRFFECVCGTTWTRVPFQNTTVDSLTFKMGRLNYRYEKKEDSTPSSSAQTLLFERRVLTFFTCLLILGVACWLAAVSTDYWVVVVAGYNGTIIHETSIVRLD